MLPGALFLVAAAGSALTLRAGRRLFRRSYVAAEHQDDLFFAEDEALAEASTSAHYGGHRGVEEAQVPQARSDTLGAHDAWEVRRASPTYFLREEDLQAVAASGDLGSPADLCSVSSLEARRRAASVRKVCDWDDEEAATSWPQGGGSMGGGSPDRSPVGSGDDEAPLEPSLQPQQPAITPGQHRPEAAGQSAKRIADRSTAASRPPSAPSQSPAEQPQRDGAPMAPAPFHPAAGPHDTAGAFGSTVASTIASTLTERGGSSTGSGRGSGRGRGASGGSGSLGSDGTAASGATGLTSSSSPASSQFTEVVEVAAGGGSTDEACTTDSEREAAAAQQRGKGVTPAEVKGAGAKGSSTLAAVGLGDVVAAASGGYGAPEVVAAAVAAGSRAVVATAALLVPLPAVPLPLPQSMPILRDVNDVPLPQSQQQYPAQPLRSSSLVQQQPALVVVAAVTAAAMENPLPSTILETHAPDTRGLALMQQKVEALRLMHLQRQAQALLSAPAASRGMPLPLSLPLPPMAMALPDAAAAAVAELKAAMGGAGKGAIAPSSPRSQPSPSQHSLSAALGSAAPGASFGSGGVSGGAGHPRYAMPPQSASHLPAMHARHASVDGVSLPPQQRPQQQGAVTSPGMSMGGGLLQPGQQPLKFGSHSGATQPMQASSPTQQELQQQILQLQRQQQQLLMQAGMRSPSPSPSPPLSSLQQQQQQWPAEAVQAARMGTLQHQPRHMQQQYQQQQQQLPQQQPQLPQQQQASVLQMPATLTGMSHMQQAGEWAMQPGGQLAMGGQAYSQSAPQAYLSGGTSTTASVGALPASHTAMQQQQQQLQHLQQLQQAMMTGMQQAGAWGTQPTISAQSYGHPPHRPTAAPHPTSSTAAAHGDSESGLLSSHPSFAHHLQPEPLPHAEAARRTLDWLDSTSAAAANAAAGSQMSPLLGDQPSLHSTHSGSSSGGGAPATTLDKVPSLRLSPHQPPPQLQQPRSSLGRSPSRRPSGNEDVFNPSSYPQPSPRSPPSGLARAPSVRRAPDDSSSPSGLVRAPSVRRTTDEGYYPSGLARSPSTRYRSGGAAAEAVEAAAAALNPANGPVPLWRIASFNRQMSTTPARRQKSITSAGSGEAAHSSHRSSSRRHRESSRARARREAAALQEKLANQAAPSPLALLGAKLMHEAGEKLMPAPRMPGGKAFFVPLRPDLRLDVSERASGEGMSDSQDLGSALSGLTTATATTGFR